MDATSAAALLELDSIFIMKEEHEVAVKAFLAGQHHCRLEVFELKTVGGACVEQFPVFTISCLPLHGISQKHFFKCFACFEPRWSSLIFHHILKNNNILQQSTRNQNFLVLQEVALVLNR